MKDAKFWKEQAGRYKEEVGTLQHKYDASLGLTKTLKAEIVTRDNSIGALVNEINALKKLKKSEVS